MLALMRERGYTVNKRNREMERGDDSKGDDGEEYRMIRDFETGEMRPVRVAKGGRIRSATHPKQTTKQNQKQTTPNDHL